MALGITLDASGPTTANQGAGGHSEKNALPDFSTAAAVKFSKIAKKFPDVDIVEIYNLEKYLTPNSLYFGLYKNTNPGKFQIFETVYSSPPRSTRFFVQPKIQRIWT